MLVLAMAIAVLWLVAMLVVVGLCVSAARGDAQLQRRTERARVRSHMRLIA